jgi:tetratricopeptide (TPR) repeat protein
VEEAVAAYRAALLERTRERVPLDWATTQMNLGIALKILAEREGSAEHLQQALDAFRLALQEITRDHVPLDWAKTQFNMGLALLVFEEREPTTDRLKEALVCFQQAGPVFHTAGIVQLSDACDRNAARLAHKLAAPPPATANPPKPGG